jgi:hypothetical protein
VEVNVEHLTNLATLRPDGFRFFAVPVKVAGMGTFPVRAFALLCGVRRVSAAVRWRGVSRADARQRHRGAQAPHSTRSVKSSR